MDISLSDGLLNTTIHYKPTDSHSYLNYNSSHPASTCKSIPFSQFLRLRRLCSDPLDFEEKASEMSQFFLTRNYPADIVTSALAKAKLISRPQSLSKADNPTSQTNTDRPVAVLTHHPHNIPIRHILLKHWDILQLSNKVGSIFSHKPLLASRRDSNIRDILVRSSVKHTPTGPPGTHPCSNTSCLTCAHLCTSTNVQGPSGSFVVKRSFNCQSRNIIYAITCRQCPKIYVGETERTLTLRFREHHADIRYNRPTPVGKHFNSTNHSVNDVRIKAIWQMFTSTTDRQEVESQFIHLLGSTQPHGLNIKN